MEGFMGLDFMKIAMATIYGALNDSLTHWVLATTLYSWCYYFHITYEANTFFLWISPFNHLVSFLLTLFPIPYPQTTIQYFMFFFPECLCFHSCCSSGLECLPFDTLPEKTLFILKDPTPSPPLCNLPESQVHRADSPAVWEDAISPVVSLASCIPKSFSRAEPHGRGINVYEHRIKSNWV